jgi:glycosyltransferase involved in cell wall biosynthesis
MMLATAPRLLSVNSYHYHRGGADNVYFQHAALMEGLGWRNAFFAMHYPKNLATEWSRFFVDEIQFGHSYSLGQKVVKAAKVIWSFEAQRQLRRLLAEFRPDVAHLHNIYHHLSPSILPVLRKAGVPTVMTAHDLKIACPNNKMYNTTGVCERCKGGRLSNVVRFRCVQDSLAASAIVAAEAAVNGSLRSYRDNVDRIVVPSRFFLEKFVEWGWPRETFRYIPNWLDATRIEADPRPGAYFLYLGRLAPEKGVATLIRAARQAGVRLAVAGDGPMRQELDALADGATDRIELFGFRSGEDLARLVRGARAVVAPSEWYENAPLSVLEAMAAGKPLLGSRIGGIPELIEEGRTGWLFKAGDVDALAGLLRKVADAPDATLEAMGREGRTRVERDYNRQAYVDAMLALYAEIGVRMPHSTLAASTDRQPTHPERGLM